MTQSRIWGNEEGKWTLSIPFFARRALLRGSQSPLLNEKHPAQHLKPSKSNAERRETRCATATIHLYRCAPEQSTTAQRLLDTFIVISARTGYQQSPEPLLGQMGS